MVSMLVRSWLLYETVLRSVSYIVSPLCVKCGGQNIRNTIKYNAVQHKLPIWLQWLTQNWINISNRTSTKTQQYMIHKGTNYYYRCFGVKTTRAGEEKTGLVAISPNLHKMSPSSLLYCGHCMLNTPFSNTEKTKDMSKNWSEIIKFRQ